MGNRNVERGVQSRDRDPVGFSHGNYFHDPRLKAAFTFQNMYLGLSPYDAPATYSLLQYTELAGGVWFPMGGLYRVIESLAALAAAHGVQFRYDAPVKQIEVEGNRATGVILEDGTRHRADVVIANADLPYAYRELLPDKAEAERLERKKYTCSALMFFWGVDQEYPQLGMHNVFLAGDYRASFDRIFRDHIASAESPFALSQSLFCRRQHASRHGAADGLDLGAADH